MTILNKIVRVKKTEVAQLQQNVPQYVLEKLIKDLPPPRSFWAAISGGNCSIIAEIKRKSPSRGELVHDFDPVRIASVYEQNGAAAVSVLTDAEFFGGDKRYLGAVKKAIGLPLLRKDFVIDAYQIYESRMIGADAVLLIAAILSIRQLTQYIRLTETLGLCPLVEVHNRAELKKALICNAKIIGINNRDLKTFITDVNTSLDLNALVPAGKIVVSESGIAGRDTIERLMQAGIHAFLIGESLMTAPNPADKLRELLNR
ncbi:MAG: indole-3-glycerol phosphate synthase TrpC [Deltaproteobacteria bacterium]|nr:indole-3-glycerol phosphate synthase TrpC [Deltaproteobacteria bacterium]